MAIIYAQKIEKYNPTPSDIRVDEPLSSYSLGFGDSQPDLLTSRIGTAGVIKAQRRTGTVFKHSQADNFRIGGGKVGDIGPLPLIEAGVTSTTYNCDIYGCAARTGQVVLDDEHESVDLAMADAELVGRTMALLLEKDFVDTVLTATPDSSTWGQTWTSSTADNFGSYVTNQWSNAGSRPVEVVDRIAKAISTATGGLRPNYMILGSDVLPVLRSHSDVIGRAPGASEVVVDEQMLSRAFGIPNVLTARASYNSAAEGAAATMTDFFGSHVWIGYINPNPRPRSRSAYARLDWVGMTDSVEGMTVKRFEDPKERAIYTHAQRSWVHKIIDLSCGAFITSVV